MSEINGLDEFEKSLKKFADVMTISTRAMSSLMTTEMQENEKLRADNKQKDALIAKLSAQVEKAREIIKVASERWCCPDECFDPEPCSECVAHLLDVKMDAFLAATEPKEKEKKE